MFLSLLDRLGHGVRRAAQERFGVALDRVAFQYPPRVELGDLALTAPFDLARSLRRKPRELAAELAQALSDSADIRRCEVAGGGYVNLYLERGAVARDLLASLRAPRPPEPVPGQVIVEHTSINPNKAAHIGHLRNAVLGDTLVRALRHRGHHVGVQNYIDDTGVQVADVVVGFMHLEGHGLEEVRRLAAAGRFDYLCWDLYARVGDFYAEDPERKKLQGETLHAIEAGDDEIARIGALVASTIVECHLRTMARLGIRYDLLAHESDILRLHFWTRAFERLKQSGSVRHETQGKNAGCWVLGMDQGSGGLDEDKILVRSNGTVTYTGKDIAYQLWKLGLLGLDFRYRKHAVEADAHVLWSTTSGEGEPGAPAFGHARAVYNVIDTGQSYPQRVVRAGVAAVGGAAAAAGSHHLAYEKVVLSRDTARELGFEAAGDGAVRVSGRKGLGVKADDLLDALVAKARAEVETRDAERDADARERSASEIAVGALRYFLLRFSRAKVITFDMQEALAFTGETGPYVQNGVVRARNILAKLESAGHPLADLLEQAAGLDLASHLEGEAGDEVWSLLMLMARTDEVAEQAIAGLEATLLAKHAFAVAQTFHGWYQRAENSVLHAATPELRAFRTAIVDAFVRQMQVLTGLLGIPIPDRM